MRTGSQTPAVAIAIAVAVVDAVRIAAALAVDHKIPLWRWGSYCCCYC